MSKSPSYQGQTKIDSKKAQLLELYPSRTNQMLEQTDHDQDGTCQQLHKLESEGPPFAKFHNSSFQFSHGPQSVSPAPSNYWSLIENQKFSAPSVQGQLPFIPECALELEVFQEWRSGNAAHQQSSASSKIPNIPAWNCGSPTAPYRTISMADYRVDFSEPSQHPETDKKCASPSVIQEMCKDPDQCELSPDMAQTMERFCVPHICEYEEAKTLLFKKIVNKVLQNAAPRIMALLEEELQKREDEMSDLESKL